MIGNNIYIWFVKNNNGGLAIRKWDFERFPDGEQFIKAEAHYARVKELLEANNVMVERVRALEKTNLLLKSDLLTMTETAERLLDSKDSK